jgi:multicomponent Na+:H+ antiporter subunit E
MNKKAPKRTKSPTSKQRTQPPPVSATMLPAGQNLYLILFLVNVIIAFGWQLLVPLFGLLDYLIGFAVGFAGIMLFHRPYGWRASRLLYFIGYVLWEILLSNLSIAKLVLQPKPQLDPGIIAIPLTVSTGLEITILASVVTLTPGTISVDLGENRAGQRVLYVHGLQVGDPDTFRRTVQQGFERLLLQVTRGTTA